MAAILSSSVCAGITDMTGIPSRVITALPLIPTLRFSCSSISFTVFSYGKSQAIGEIVQSSKYFKNLNGEIVGFEQYGDIDFAIVRYQWYDSVVDYPAIASSLFPVQETRLSKASLVEDNPQPTAENPQGTADNQQFKIGDRVKVLKHQFVGDRIGAGIGDVERSKQLPEKLQKEYWVDHELISFTLHQ